MSNITVVDTTTPGSLSGFSKDDDFAGYVGGRFADLSVIERDFPDHYFLSIAVNSSERAEFADFEKGDFQSLSVLIKWIREMQGEGIWRPGPYADESTMDQILPEICRSIPRPSIRTWGAKWDGNPVIPAAWDGKQYETMPGGKNVDLSIFRENAFPIHAKPRKERIPHTTPRIWKNPVKAIVTFNPENGKWEAAGQ